MTLTEPLLQRLQFLIRVIKKEINHLDYSSHKIFQQTLTLERISRLDSEPAFAEQLEAFTSRFCRLQDSLGDKLVPVWLESLGEPKRSVVDNLDKAAQLGIRVDADEWLMIRQLRNKMVHEYIEAPEILLEALQAAHDFEPSLVAMAEDIFRDLERHGIKEEK